MRVCVCVWLMCAFRRVRVSIKSDLLWRVRMRMHGCLIDAQTRWLKGLVCFIIVTLVRRTDARTHAHKVTELLMHIVPTSSKLVLLY